MGHLFKAIILSLLVLPAFGGQKAPESNSIEAEKALHADSILGIRVGMATPQVLDLMGGRMPDKREDKNGEIIVYWKQQNGDILQVRFRDDNFVSYVGLQYKTPKPTGDFWLKKYAESSDGKATEFKVNPALSGPGDISTVGGRTMAENTESAPRLSSSQGTSELTGKDERLHREYKVTQTVDLERTVWVRDEKTEDGYTILVGFISTDRKKQGSNYEDWVQFKYVQVDERDLKRFDQAVTHPVR